ncbi:Trm112p-domain-containing protein [Polyplosphaeria fusca]|uniref:Trm112p-domain-containing protein n=1 Tax=Polyplosphaeria fusca TaxID=682080 RepID=A0A9P4V0Q6_9PLEO|nr:Trm112p-domain-containing protein [Polyplosphaeria fusca]
MKLLTLNFLTCAIKSCKSSPASFPLHPRDATLEIIESDLNLAFLRNILPRLMWSELCTITRELGLPALPETVPTGEDMVEKKEGEEEVASQTAKDLHRVLLETGIREGGLVCGNCGHEYKVLEGVGNFLLPGHLV